MEVHGLSECDVIIIEARRVLLNEDIEKMADISLSILNKYCDRNFTCAVTDSDTKKCRKCKNCIDWNDRTFWENLPNPRNIDTDPADVSPLVPKHYQQENQTATILIKELLHPYLSPDSDLLKSKDLKLCRKYFNQWRLNIQYMKDQKTISGGKLQEKEKLNSFMKKLKICKKKMKEKYSIKEAEYNGLETSDLSTRNNILNKSVSQFSISFDHRFAAQKYIIDRQKAKLNEQNKIIEELKFGIIIEDLSKSIDSTKVNIREIFANCSESVKSKIPITLVEETQLTIDTQKAPNIIKKMEKRAAERALNRQIIRERKRVMEEHRLRLLEEAIGKKKVLEEEERLKNLESMKERRRKELENNNIRQANKQRYLDNLHRAIRFHNRLILKKCLKELNYNMQLSKQKYFLACHHYNKKTVQSCMNSWMEYMYELYRVKNELADAHFEYIILRQCMRTWRDEHLESVRNLQVAEDIYDLQLTYKTFIYWHRYVCTQIILENTYTKISEQHYKRKILFYYFHQWRSLKAVILLEKAKELRKQKWREKVWEILPDFRPPAMDF